MQRHLVEFGMIDEKHALDRRSHHRLFDPHHMLVLDEGRGAADCRGRADQNVGAQPRDRVLADDADIGVVGAVVVAAEADEVDVVDIGQQCRRRHAVGDDGQRLDLEQQRRNGVRRGRIVQDHRLAGFDIVHRGAGHTLVVPSEAEWLDQVDRRGQAGAQAHHGTDIAGDLGLKERDPHYPAR